MRNSTDGQKTTPRATRSRRSVRGKNGANQPEPTGGAVRGSINVALTKQRKRTVPNGEAILLEDPIAADNEQAKATSGREDTRQLIEYVSFPHTDCYASSPIQAKCATYEERIRFLEIQLVQAIRSLGAHEASLESAITALQRKLEANEEKIRNLSGELPKMIQPLVEFRSDAAAITNRQVSVENAVLELTARVEELLRPAGRPRKRS
jgi:hypothetical protein